MVFQLHLDTETVAHIGPSEPFCIGPELSVREVLGRMKAEKRGSVLVCREEKLVGIFTERDALQVMARGADLDVPIEQYMSRQPAIIAATDSVQSAITRMSRGGYRRLPVVDAEMRPVGLLKVSHILHYLVQHFPKFIYNLPPHSDPTIHQREGA